MTWHKTRRQPYTAPDAKCLADRYETEKRKDE